MSDPSTAATTFLSAFIDAFSEGFISGGPMANTMEHAGSTAYRVTEAEVSASQKLLCPQYAPYEAVTATEIVSYT